jgi:hypothetical protein
MKKDKITAMWEEDGDLMLLKKFFNYIHQDENIKKRIKEKTLAKIAAPDETAKQESAEQHIPVQQTFWSRIKGFKRGRTVIKAFSAAAVITLAVCLGSILSSSGFLPSPMPGSQTKDLSEEVQYSSSTNAAGAPEMSVAMDGYDARKADEGPLRSSLPSNQPAEDALLKQKIIYTADVSLKVEDVKAAVSAITEKVSSVDGYISESRINVGENETTGYLIAKIPANQFNAFKGDLSQFGTISDEHMYTDDISRQYFDVETRLRSWQAQEERYLDILKKAETVEDILKIENSLANVRQEIEALKGQLKYWDNRVDYSEIRISVSAKKSDFSVSDPWQPVSIVSTIVAAKNAVIKSVSFIWNTFNRLIIYLGYAFPLILLVLAGWFGYRKWRKR